MVEEKQKRKRERNEGQTSYESVKKVRAEGVNEVGRGNHTLAGLICVCNSRTKKYCFCSRVFGLPKWDLVGKIKAGTKLFLYDLDAKLMYGMYEATSPGGMGLEPHAFRGAWQPFPAQVYFRILEDCMPVREEIFRKVIMENYKSANDFNFELNDEQVKKLTGLFRPLPRREKRPHRDDRARAPATATVELPGKMVEARRKRERNEEETSYECVKKARRDTLAGLICVCNSKTKKDCFRYRVFGLPKWDLAEKIEVGMKLFLYDLDANLMYGMYEALSCGGMGLEPHAFRGDWQPFPAQVYFQTLKDCMPLREKIFRKAIEENYDSANEFTFELNEQQVNKLTALFRPLAHLSDACSAS